MYLLQQVFIIHFEDVVLQHGDVGPLVLDLLGCIFILLILRDQLAIFPLLVFKLKVYLEEFNFGVESISEVIVFPEINESVSFNDGVALVVLLGGLLHGLLEHFVHETSALLFSDDILVRLQIILDLMKVNERTTLLLGEVCQLTLRIAVVLRIV